MSADPQSADYVDKLLIAVKEYFQKNQLPADLKDQFPRLGKREPGEWTRDDLWNYPKLQQALSYIVGYTPSKWLLEQELATIKDIRGIRGSTGKPCFPRNEHEDIYTWARDCRLTGLCLSGGGIRSATFNLGILQGLAARNWLHKFDYLSSVSGGGYIHSWLAA